MLDLSWFLADTATIILIANAYFKLVVTFSTFHYLLIPITPIDPLKVDFGAGAFFVGDGVGVGGLKVVGFGVGVDVGVFGVEGEEVTFTGG
ncbi:hypothetical protein UFOVP696_111 [uncultured Caudovirales phage]|uniref:Uncharacterized protein n=1 Tax=uncultured Caudovirales phage TaxID=2100421 RepID=A0A6J5NH47_9CAUD|nr:hypothetical protein UFOVP429_56 [uncultured Caudovirales phage]CAB4158243.1 hypothetical protein UFOVP696_111 [uncultured Caudovirales phage]